MVKQTILITGASSGVGKLAAVALAKSGHTDFASFRGTTGKNSSVIAEYASIAKKESMDLHTLELDITSDASARSAIEKVVSLSGRLDVLVHNAGHMTFGPLEAFTAEQIAQVYDINVASTQRVNRAALPIMRNRKGDC